MISHLHIVQLVNAKPEYFIEELIVHIFKDYTDDVFG